MMWNRSAAHNPEYRWLQALLFLYQVPESYIHIYIYVYSLFK